jgi:hypothetical protein
MVSSNKAAFYAGKTWSVSFISVTNGLRFTRLVSSQSDPDEGDNSLINLTMLPRSFKELGVWLFQVLLNNSKFFQCQLALLYSRDNQWHGRMFKKARPARPRTPLADPAPSRGHAFSTFPSRNQRIREHETLFMVTHRTTHVIWLCHHS